ncbi:branched-chain amino acid ABC transporter permease [Rhizobium rhizogenes]|uniref:branched-chain amino acid ABC transporter permease n=1 Tax=Rhizobium rhizogenes TaxID=359 RepID=UPI0004D9C92E|nr:branched-chain amino acid ABC transporter permease [Rhizobium rhizogenes]KEA06413.1 ABC transporter permease [Rhizobium rhizogenes]MQB30037.1 branched-chain amino acid ABC transporter permease [Rhizobium rhizogenes]NTF68514.1 branched-chain amino acid ABC transporter permease [Rhizobium rhizogenes]NTI81180.1 branched-chain amino acid ABC transporter permease [Rhizobium rhizogenes]NTJ23366.1 branched-chain amino acid ABC transporter permease [Rhizobium rhizogenes]
MQTSHSAFPALKQRVSDVMRRSARWSVLELAFWALAVTSWFLFPNQHLILTEIVGFAILALSIDLMLGYAGIVSLGQAAMYGVGAYASGLFSIHVTGEPLSGLVVGALSGTVVAFLTSFLLLRGGDLTRLMVTLGVAAVFAEIANQANWLTGGADGLQGITINPLFGVFDFDIYGHTGYAYNLAVLFVLFLLARLIVSSPFGYSLKAIRDNPLRASAVGVPVNARLVAIYTLSGAYAGIAGALFAQTQQFISLDALSFQKSADGLMILVIGGTGYLYGGIIGALVYELIQDGLSSLTPQYWQFWLGMLLVAFVLIGRDRPRQLVLSLSARLTTIRGNLFRGRTSTRRAP